MLVEADEDQLTGRGGRQEAGRGRNVSKAAFVVYSIPQEATSFSRANFIPYSQVHDIQSIHNPALHVCYRNECYDYFITDSFIYVELQ